MSESVSYAAEGTGGGLVKFLDRSIAKGDLKQATGMAMKTACKEVLSATEGEDWEAVDLDTLDVEDTLRRFETLRAMKFSTGSLGTYKGRFTKSVRMFSDFRANPASWSPNVKQRSRTPKVNGSQAGSPSTAPESSTSEQHTPAGNRATLIKYPFPVRDGVLVSVELPADLNKREAKRLSAFIDSLAIEEQMALPPGPPSD